jgi:hypothetical protein
MLLKMSRWMLIGLMVIVPVAGVTQIVTTQVADTIYHADGTPATGTVLVSWPAFTTSNGDVIASGSMSATIATGGALSVQLIANAGSTPIGSYYTAVFHLDDSTVSRQYWIVPISSASVKLAGIESTVLPTSVAMQTVSKSYVDTAIATAVAGHPLDSSPYVMKAGDTMTGPLVLPADPVSANQAADKNYVDESVAAVSGGLAQKVSTLPTGTQIVAQPTGTQLDVNRLNDVEYASQYVAGPGNNGIANAVASTDCTSGCEVKVEQDYGNEAYFTAGWNNNTHVEDARGGVRRDNYINPLNPLDGGSGIGQSVNLVATQSAVSLFQQTANQDPASIGVSINHQGLAGGSNLFPTDIEAVPYFKMGYSALAINGTYNAQGQHGLVPETIDCFGVGDCLIGAQFIFSSGGFRDGGDEGTHAFDLETAEDSRVFQGTCTSGCSAGATDLTVSATSSAGTQGEGRFLIDKNPSTVIANTPTGGIISAGPSGSLHPSALFGGTSFPMSVFLSTAEVIQSQSNNLAPGMVTVPIATSGVPTGFATNTAALGVGSGVACVVNLPSGDNAHNYEMAQFTVVDSTHLQMTLNKPHTMNATVAFGGLCGYGLEQTVDTANGIRQVFPVIGSYAPNALYYAGHNTPIVGLSGSTSAFLNLSVGISTLTRSGGTVTVETVGDLPVDVNGLTLTITGAGDSSYNGSYPVTTTGMNSLTYPQLGANSSSTGGTLSIWTGGFALYPMAEVLSVFNPATKSVDGEMTLAPNTVAWATNDLLEEPHYYEEKVSGDTLRIYQTTPRPISFQNSGQEYWDNVGPDLTGWSISNMASASNYFGYGGTHGVPEAAYEATGIWKRTMDLGAGEEAVFSIHCKQSGCGYWNSRYNLFELASNTGTDTLAYSPLTNGLQLSLDGVGYSFTPQSFTAGTINVGSLNATTIGAIAPGPVSATQLNGVPVSEYTNVARKPMVTLLQALHNAKNQPVNLVVLADSFAICDYTNCSAGPTVSANRWTEQMRISLQNQFGSHGTGMVPLTYSVGPHINAESWSVSGSWDASTGTLGPSQSGENGLIHLANGAVATFSSAIPYDTINTYCMTTASSGSISVAIDGVSAGVACSSATSGATAHVAATTSIALGVHTTTFTSTGDSYLYAAEGTAGSTGVSVHNLAVGGATSEFFGAAPATQLAFSDLIPTGTQGVITMFQTNDAASGLNIPSFTAAMESMVGHEQALSGTPSVLLAVPPVDAVAGLAPYTAAQVAIAQQESVAFVNVQDRWGSSYVSSSGLWDLGPAYPGIHPNDKGSLDEYSMIYAALIDPVPYGGGSGGGSLSLSTNNHFGPASYSGGTLNIPQYGMNYDYLELSNATSATTSDNSTVYMANTAGQVVNLPPANDSALTSSGCASGVQWCGPTRQVQVYNSTLPGTPGNITVVPPSGWNVYGAGCASNVCTVAAGDLAIFTTFNIATGPQNWFRLTPPSGSSAGTACSASCAFTGQSTFTDGATTGGGYPIAMSSSSPWGTYFTIGASDSLTHKWGFHSQGSYAGSPGNFAIGDFTTGHYVAIAHVDGSANGFWSLGSAGGSCWSSTGDPTAAGPDTCLWRSGTSGSVSLGNATAGDASGSLSLSSISATLYKGPATAPSGSCSSVGWTFSQDGHATFCNGSTWVTKI